VTIPLPRLTVDDFLVLGEDVTKVSNSALTVKEALSTDWQRALTDAVTACQGYAREHLERLNDGHEDPLAVSEDHPEFPPHWWGIRSWTRHSDPLWMKITVGSSTGADRAGITPLWCHPSEEFVREVARQLLVVERLSYRRVSGFREDDTRAYDTSPGLTYRCQWRARDPYRVALVRITDYGIPHVEETFSSPYAWSTDLLSGGDLRADGYALRSWSADVSAFHPRLSFGPSETLDTTGPTPP
jgi:hypothetical protein